MTIPSADLGVSGALFGVESRPPAFMVTHLSRRALLGRAGILLGPVLLSRARWAAGEPAPLDVRGFGPTGNGKTKDTRAIQDALDAAGRSGGTIQFPPGEYVSGTLRLRGRVTLRLAAGVTLIASPDDGDFDPHEELGYDSFADRETTDLSFALLQGRGLQQVRIVGPGPIARERTRRSAPLLRRGGPHRVRLAGRGGIEGNRSRRGAQKPIALKQCGQIEIH